ncbi:MAG: GGDEF domain-containing protein [Campylobacterota bacterium]|nr:GGDEF domain-containing protein [Campylobacterota bacterium]
MEKDNLKSLIIHIYDNLLKKIDNDEIVDKEKILNYLRDSMKVVADSTQEDISSIKTVEEEFKNVYEEIADKSLSSYEQTNQKFEQLTKLHIDTLISCTEKIIDVPSIVDNLNEIQNQMMDEIKKANEVISQLSKQVEVLQRDSNLDPLTKVFNRRALATYLEDMCSNKSDFKLNKHHLLILDIDDFKIINDTYGHITGDKILIFIANIMKKTLKNYNKIFRFGGEEFIIILDDISDLESKAIALKLLDLIRKSKLIYKGKSIGVTISIGSTTLLQNDTPDSIVARADKALYKAKHKGKDQMYSEINNGI